MIESEYTFIITLPNLSYSFIKLLPFFLKKKWKRKCVVKIVDVPVISKIEK